MTSRTLYTPLANGVALMATPTEYISRDYIHIYRRVHSTDTTSFIGTEMAEGVDFNWTSQGTVTLTVPSDGNTDYLIQRDTPDTPIVQQSPGVFSSSIANLAVLQAIHIAQESEDRGQGYNDAFLRAQLAASTGAAMVGIALGLGDLVGRTVQDAIFARGRAAPIAGSKARINWLREDALAALEDVAGLWAGPVVMDHGINKVFDATLGGANAPSTTLFVRAKNTGSLGDIVAGMFVAEVASANKTAFGMNIIAWSSGGVNGAKLVGLEIDLQPQAGTTPSSVAGLYLNAFSMSAPGPAIYFEGVFGGKWGTGISAGNLSDTGAALGPAAGNPRMGTLFDSGTAQYQIGAGKFNNGHKMLWMGTGPTTATAASLHVDGSDNLHIVLPPQNVVFRSAGDTNSLVSIDQSGNLNLEAGGRLILAAGLSSGAATAGAATLPANPVGFFTVKVGATDRKVPYYAN